MGCSPRPGLAPLTSVRVQVQGGQSDLDAKGTHRQALQGPQPVIARGSLLSTYGTEGAVSTRPGCLEQAHGRSSKGSHLEEGPGRGQASVPYARTCSL